MERALVGPEPVSAAPALQPAEPVMQRSNRPVGDASTIQMLRDEVRLLRQRLDALERRQLFTPRDDSRR